MRIKINTEVITKLIIFIINPLIIIIAMQYGIKDIMTIHVASDEFGYWTAAANIIGYDWSRCASLNEYYSFGYGVILAPLLLLKDPILVYKSALFLNIAFVVVSYFLLIKIASAFENTMSSRVYSFISLLICLYPGLIFYTKLSLVECFLWFLFILSVYFVQQYILTEKLSYFLMATIVDVFALWVHMRNIGILVALLVSLVIYIIVSKKKSIKFVLVLGITVVGLIGLVFFKAILKNMQYSDSILTGNEVGGQIQKILLLLSIGGIKKFFLNIVGRIWYLGNTSFFLFYYGIYSCLKRVIKSIKNRDVFCLVYLYVLLSAVFALIISTIFMIDLQGGRRDTLFYGRYSEHIIAPILVMGLLDILENDKTLRKMAAFSVVHLMGAKIVRNTVIAYNMSSCLDFSIPGFYYWIKRENFSNECYISASLIMVLIVVLVLVAYYRWNYSNIVKFMLMIVVCILSINIGYKSYEISDTHDHDEDYYEVYNCIEEATGKEDLSVVYCYDNNDLESYYSFMGVDRIQFLLKNEIIYFCNFNEQRLKEKSIVITRPDSKVNEELQQIGICILQNKEFNIYEY